MKKIIEHYYVITWDFNKDQIEKYNIMDYLISCYKATKKSKKFFIMGCTDTLSQKSECTGVDIHF